MAAPQRERGPILNRMADASALPTRRSILPGREVVEHFDRAKEAAITHAMPSAVSVHLLAPERYNHLTREMELGLKEGGAGFVIESSPEEVLIATNRHVVNNLRKNPHWSLNIQSSYVAPDGSDRKGENYDSAKVVYMSPDFDVAFISVDPSNHEALPAATLGSAENLFKGQSILTIGDPYAIADTVAVGIVSHEVATVIPTEFGKNPYIRIDAAVRHGNSGGPAIDLATDEVVGVTTANVAEDPTMGFMIPIDVFKAELARFKALREAGGETVPPLFPDLPSASQDAEEQEAAFVN